MIKSFRHKGLRLFFEMGASHGIHAAHVEKVRRILSRLNHAEGPSDMNIPGWKMHALKGGELRSHYSVWVSANWRITFTFEEKNAVFVDYQDYH